MDNPNTTGAGNLRLPRTTTWEAYNWVRNAGYWEWEKRGFYVWLDNNEKWHTHIAIFFNKSSIEELNRAGAVEIWVIPNLLRHQALGLAKKDWRSRQLIGG
mgnify:CR=1 FL=1